MAKITLTKKLRKHYLGVEKDGVLVDISPNATPREKIGICRFCKFPVYAAPGQLLKWTADLDGTHQYTHKHCREKN